jgi:hypothetical protein
VERIQLESLDYVIERVWVAEPIQGRQPVIRLGRLADGRWWAAKEGLSGPGAWVFGDELRAEAAAHRWSEQSKLRWRPATVKRQPSPTMNGTACPAATIA